ncbi:MAG: hypothetical protein GY753_18875 [Gammaproteobacteria bacterium]|nr:hypothetical protein [Gammaproteobacteria bacterium]
MAIDGRSTCSNLAWATYGDGELLLGGVGDATLQELHEAYGAGELVLGGSGYATSPSDLPPWGFRPSPVTNEFSAFDWDYLGYYTTPNQGFSAKSYNPDGSGVRDFDPMTLPSGQQPKLNGSYGVMCYVPPGELPGTHADGEVIMMSKGNPASSTDYYLYRFPLIGEPSLTGTGTALTPGTYVLDTGLKNMAWEIWRSFSGDNWFQLNYDSDTTASLMGETGTKRVYGTITNQYRTGNANSPGSFSFDLDMASDDNWFSNLRGFSSIADPDGTMTDSHETYLARLIRVPDDGNGYKWLHGKSDGSRENAGFNLGWVASDAYGWDNGAAQPYQYPLAGQWTNTTSLPTAGQFQVAANVLRINKLDDAGSDRLTELQALAINDIFQFEKNPSGNVFRPQLTSLPTTVGDYVEYTFVERSDSNDYTDNALHDVNIMANNPQANIRYKDTRSGNSNDNGATDNPWLSKDPFWKHNTRFKTSTYVPELGLIISSGTHGMGSRNKALQNEPHNYSWARYVEHVYPTREWMVNNGTYKWDGTGPVLTEPAGNYDTPKTGDWCLVSNMTSGNPPELWKYTGGGGEDLSNYDGPYPMSEQDLHGRISSGDECYTDSNAFTSGRYEFQHVTYSLATVDPNMDPDGWPCANGAKGWQSDPHYAMLACQRLSDVRGGTWEDVINNTEWIYPDIFTNDTFSTDETQSKQVFTLGSAYDPIRKRVYIAQKSGNGADKPIIHAFQLTGI